MSERNEETWRGVREPRYPPQPSGGHASAAELGYGDGRHSVDYVSGELDLRGEAKDARARAARDAAGPTGDHSVADSRGDRKTGRKQGGR